MSGEERPKKAWYKKWWVWAIAVVVAAAIGGMNKGGGGGASTGSTTANEHAATSSAGTTEQKEPAPAPIAVTAQDYYAAYESNEVSADAKYKGKTIAISGIVDRVTKTLGTVSVHLKAGEFIESVDCELANEQDAAKLNKGQSVTLVGIGDGKMMFPEVDDCQVK